MRNIFSVILSFLFVQSAFAQFQYVSPLPGSQNLSINHNIIIRQGSKLDPSSIESSLFTIQGSKSGKHDFILISCGDEKTINLNPKTPFAFGETVSVTISKGLMTIEGNVIDAYGFSFTTRLEWNTAGQNQVSDDDSTSWKEGFIHSQSEDKSDVRKFTGMLTIIANSNPAPGYIFFDCRPAIWGTSDYNSINVINNNGDSVFHRTFSPVPYDLQLGKNGYFGTFQGNIDKFIVMDSNFAVIDTYTAANGYLGDPHDLQMLANGYAFLVAGEEQMMMVQINDSTLAEKNVRGSVIQEFDPDHNVIFEWRSFDHVEIYEGEHVNLNASTIDYIHTNSIDVDGDGNIIVSHRNIDQITKIDVNTGEFIWRLGGVNNEFTFVNDSDRFSYQHDCRRIANGNITLYDDGNYHVPAKSYAKEYQLDETNMTATLVWSYSHPDVNGLVVYNSAMGSVQRLPNGNTFIGWGLRTFSSFPSMTEVDSGGNIVWELQMNATQNLVNYRAHKYEWSPCARPTFKLLNTTDITNHSAKLKWASVANPSQQYEVQYKKHVDSVWFDVKVDASNLFLDIDSLDANTDYDWRIQSWCDTVAGTSSHFTDTVQFTTLLATGIDEPDTNNVELYPNPASDLVEIRSTFTVSKIRIINLLGQEVKTFLLNEESADQPIQISLSNLPTGNYLVEVTGEETREVRKLVVE